ncbi:MAG: hypothetical protein KTR31_37820 [Myxococcales bacterium]|nr:hypothetical protein [Myxococcales bacterium]
MSRFLGLCAASSLLACSRPDTSEADTTPATTADTSAPTDGNPPPPPPDAGPAVVQVFDERGIPAAKLAVLVHGPTGAFQAEHATDAYGQADVLVQPAGMVTVIAPDDELSVTVYDVYPDDVLTLGQPGPLTFGPALFAGPSEFTGADRYRLAVSCFPVTLLYDPADTTELTLPLDCLDEDGTFDAIAWAYTNVTSVVKDLEPLAWSVLEDLPGKPAAHVMPEWQDDLIETTLTLELPETPAIPGLRSARLSYGMVRDGVPLMTDWADWRNLLLEPATFDLAFPASLKADGGRAWITVSRSTGAGHVFDDTTYVSDQADLTAPWEVPASALARRLHAEWDDKAGQLDLVLTPEAGPGAGFVGWVQWSDGGRRRWGFAAPPDQTSVAPPQVPAAWSEYLPSPKRSLEIGFITWHEVPDLSWDTLKRSHAGGDIFPLASYPPWTNVPGALIEVDRQIGPEEASFPF